MHTDNISEEEFLRFVEQHYSFPGVDEQYPEGKLDDGTMYGALGKIFFRFVVVDGKITSLEEIQPEDIPLEAVTGSEHVEYIFECVLSEEDSMECARRWIVRFAEVVDIAAVTAQQVTGIFNMLDFCKVSWNRDYTLTSTELIISPENLAMCQFLLAAMKQKAYPWNFGESKPEQP